MTSLVYDLAHLHRYMFFALFLALMIGALELGRLLGKRRRAQLDGRRDEGATLVVGSVLGLLAFVLALNLSHASSRYDRRMTSTLEEVNALGTALMQATAVGGEQADELTAKLRQYMQLRRAYIIAPGDDATLRLISNQTNEMQNAIWALLVERMAESPGPPVTSLMNAINNAFDASTAMRLAMEYRMPEQLVLLLLMMSLLSTATVGYQFGLIDHKGRVPGIVLSVLWCVVVTEIIDIGSARIWTLRTDTRVYDWTIETFEGLPDPVQ